MSLSIHKKLGFGIPKPTSLTLMMEDRSVNQPFDILCDVLVKVYMFIFPETFIILDLNVDFKVPIIMGDHFWPLDEHW